ncbi:MAG: hypothetical protein ACN6OQ_00375 [Paraburkholderia nemoris]
MHANLVQGHAAHAKVVNVAAKPAVVHTNAPAKAANVAASPAAAAPANPATASSGSLPPILR